MEVLFVLFWLMSMLCFISFLVTVVINNTLVITGVLTEFTPANGFWLCVLILILVAVFYYIEDKRSWK